MATKDWREKKKKNKIPLKYITNITNQSKLLDHALENLKPLYYRTNIQVNFKSSQQKHHISTVSQA